MLQIPYNSSDFSPHLGAAFRGKNVLGCTWAEIVHSAITVGRQNKFDVLRFGQHSLLELVYRAVMVYANLQQNGNSLARSLAYDSLDPSEKGAVSYYLGLVVAKLFAMRLLNIRWLMHLDVYQNILSPVFAPGKSRPDLVGVNDLREWAVVESKGRTGTINAAVLMNAKRQTRRLRKVGNQLVSVRIAMVTYFQESNLSMAWSDPDNYDDNGFDLNIDIEGFMALYYEPIRQLLRSFEGRLVEWNPPYQSRLNQQIRQFLVASIPEADMNVGLAEPIYRNFLRAGDILDGRLVVGTEGLRQTFIGKDGVLVQLGDSWSEAIMSRSPYDRSQKGDI